MQQGNIFNVKKEQFGSIWWPQSRTFIYLFIKYCYVCIKGIHLLYYIRRVGEYVMENPSNSEYDFIKQTEELSFTFLVLLSSLYRIVHFYKK